MPTLALNDDLVLPVSQALAWRALHDLTLLADSLPDGARLAAGDAPRSHALVLPGFEGVVTVLDLEVPSRLRLRIDDGELVPSWPWDMDAFRKGAERGRYVRD